jgi:hypothetical protein
MVNTFMRYIGRRKNLPNKIRHKAPPKGSSITPRSPFSKYSDDAPKIVSDPNHVAKSADAERNKGNCRPANTKSFEFLTSLEDQAPIATVISR